MSSIQDWDNFFVAESGAAAALSGLVFVAVSISLRPVLASPHLCARARETLQTFLAVLAIATCGLIPDQSAVALGTEIAGFGALSWLIATWRHLRPS
jgi:modulator of FtsH protease